MNKIRLLVSIFILVIITIISTKINANEITNDSEIKQNGEKISTKITDNKESTYITISKNSEIEITSKQDIYSIYIVYEFSSKTGTITGNNKTIDIGKNNFLHEYISINDKIGATKNIKIKYNEDVKIWEKENFQILLKYGIHLVKKQIYYCFQHIVMMSNYFSWD